MHFSLTHSRLGRKEVTYWSLDQPGSSAVSPTDINREIILDGVKRTITARVARMILAFEANAQKRELLGHDCAVFALACQTGDDYRDVMFGRRKDSPRISPIKPAAARADEIGSLLPGSIIRTSGLMLGSHHYAVCASADRLDPPLLASKYGLDGPVALSTLPQIGDAYPITYIDHVKLMTCQIG